MTPATLKRRLAALIYESLLIGAVTAGAGMLIGAINTLIAHFVPSFTLILPFTTTLFMLSAWWFYFKLNWLREGQTLAMRVWKIGITDLNGQRPNTKRLFIRFIWACILLVFLPLLVYAILHHMAQFTVKSAAWCALSWWILPWGFALLNPRRQFLYDYLSGTELIDWQNKN